MKHIVEKEEFTIVHEFNAPKELVFNAFSKEEALAEWWGPVECKNSVLKLDFKTGGMFHYKMEKEGQVNYGRFIFGEIQPHDLLEFTNSFSDANGNIVRAPFDIQLPLEIFYRLIFTETDGTTIITLTGQAINATPEERITLQSINEDMKKGFGATFGQLEKYLQARFELHRKLKPNNMARTTTYLNFPGTTEKAFNFYKSVFGTEFNGKGIQRFGDIPAGSGHPPVDESIKKMVLHVELPILGGHVLMATDAPKEVGMTLTQGNNMHICLEPSTKAETKKLFESLSKGGVIIMPLEEMFFGSYFGQCTDQFGINWMVNCTEKK